MSNLTPEDLEKFKELEQQADKQFGGDRDQAILKHIVEGKEQSSIRFKKVVVPWADTNKFRIAMVMAPSWSVLFPPYNIAKLTAILRQEQYSVKVYESNIECYHSLLEQTGEDYWAYIKYYFWHIEENYRKYLLPYIKNYLDDVIEDIINSDVRVAGFSMYTTNIYSVLYIVNALRERKPELCIIVGGPETFNGHHEFEEGGKFYNLFNYIFVGEAEDNLLKVLDELPEELPLNVIVGSTNSRLELSKYPYPDYTDYDIRNYQEAGVSMESSRGCIAQCSFCTETYFWKYRSLDPIRTVEEVEYLVKKHKVKRFWFVDSLANGNLKAFEQFIDEVLKRKLNIKWHVLARCDGRMDFIFIRKAVAAGCTALAFGIESGSQKVLDDMRKKVDVWEIENNMRDVKKSGMYTHTTWVVGFPTEEAVDHFHSMQTVYNIRLWTGAMSPGFTMAVAKGSHSESHYRVYGIVGTEQLYSYKTTFLGQWYTEGYKNTIVHRFIRLKFFHIWLDLLKIYKNSIVINAHAHSTIRELYTFELKDKVSKKPDYIEQDFYVNFDYFQGTFADTILNEYIGFMYLLYKTFGRCKFTLTCDPKKDLDLFGDYVARPYTCYLEIRIEKGDKFYFKCDHELRHVSWNKEIEGRIKEELESGDMSFFQSVEKTGYMSEFQTVKPIVRETIHPQYRKNRN